MLVGERWKNELERLVAERGCEAVGDYYQDASLRKQKPRRGEEILLSKAQAEAMVVVLRGRPTAKPQSIAAYARDMAIILRALGDPQNATPKLVERTLRLTVARKRVALLRALLAVGGHPELVPKRVSLRESRSLRDDEILALEDINSLIRAAPSLRDRALLAVLWETGARIHEVLALRLSDAFWARGNGEQYLKVFLHKTKVAGEEHSSLLVEATPFLKGWMDAYPFGRSKEAPLFASSDGRRFGEALSYEGAYFLLRTIAARAGVSKPIHPHAFRHARITHLLRLGLPDNQVKKMVGLSPRSTMLARYGHLVSADIDNAILRAHGKAPLEAPRAGGLLQPEGELVPAVPLVDNRPRPESVQKTEEAITKAAKRLLASRPGFQKTVEEQITKVVEAELKRLLEEGSDDL